MADPPPSFLAYIFQYWNNGATPRYEHKGTHTRKDYKDASTQPERVLRGRIAKKWRKSTQNVRTKGLKNPGNHCYRNAMVQCLFHLPEFSQYLGSTHTSCDNRNACLVCALQDLERVYWSGDGGERGLDKERNEFNRILRATALDWYDIAADLKNGSQSDAFGFLEYLLDNISFCELGGEAYKLSDLFTVQNDTAWTCESCKETTRRSDSGTGHGWGISLDIQNPERGLSLVTYLRNEYNEELQISCESEKCKGVSREESEIPLRSRRRLITYAPEILIIRLRRFTAEPIPGKTHQKEEKVNEPCDFEEYLDVGEFTKSEEPLMYKLQGVVSHFGDSLSGGHYIAGVRRRDDSRLFASINDGLVRTCPGYGRKTFRRGKVIELERPYADDEFDPYVLVYSKM